MKEYKQEIIDFINEHNLNDIFVIEDDFYNEYECHLYVYIRVSTENQDFGRQILEIYEWAKKKNIKICIDYIYCDKYTGKTLNRKNYKYVRDLLKENDYLLTTNLSRLGRDYEGIKKEWYYFKYRNIRVLVSDKDVNEYISSPLPFEPEVVSLNRMYLQDIIFANSIYKDALKILEVSNSTKSGLRKAKMQGKKIGRPSQNTISTKENLVKTLKLCINEEKSYYNACLITRYPLGTFRLKLKQIRDNYKVKELPEILNILESEEN